MTKYAPLEIVETGYDPGYPDELLDLNSDFISRGPKEMRSVLHPDWEGTSRWADGVLYIPGAGDIPEGAGPGLCVSRRQVVGYGHDYFEGFRDAVAGQLEPDGSPLEALIPIGDLLRVPGMSDIVGEWPEDVITIGGLVFFGHKQAGPVSDAPPEVAARLGGRPPFKTLPLRKGTELNIVPAFLMHAKRDPRDNRLRVVGRTSLGVGVDVPLSLWQQWQAQNVKGAPAYTPPPALDKMARYIIEAPHRAT